MRYEDWGYMIRTQANPQPHAQIRIFSSRHAAVRRDVCTRADTKINIAAIEWIKHYRLNSGIFFLSECTHILISDSFARVASSSPKNPIQSMYQHSSERKKGRDAESRRSGKERKKPTKPIRISVSKAIDVFAIRGRNGRENVNEILSDSQKRTTNDMRSINFYPKIFFSSISEHVEMLEICFWPLTCSRSSSHSFTISYFPFHFKWHTLT